MTKATRKHQFYNINTSFSGYIRVMKGKIFGKYVSRTFNQFSGISGREFLKFSWYCWYNCSKCMKHIFQKSIMQLKADVKIDDWGSLYWPCVQGSMEKWFFVFWSHTFCLSKTLTKVWNLTSSFIFEIILSTGYIFEKIFRISQNFLKSFFSKICKT